MQGDTEILDRGFWILDSDVGFRVSGVSTLMLEVRCRMSETAVSEIWSNELNSITPVLQHSTTTCFNGPMDERANGPTGKPANRLSFWPSDG